MVKGVAHFARFSRAPLPTLRSSGRLLVCLAASLSVKTYQEDAGFDCNDGYEHWIDGWSAMKKEHCCRQEGRGCEFDCEAGRASWKNAWSSMKMDYCCKMVGIGCEDESVHLNATAMLLEKDSRTSLSVKTHQEDAGFDCNDGYDRWIEGWSAMKKEYCCRQEGKACEFDCEAGRANWRNAWSSMKMDYCCKVVGIGCEDESLQLNATAMLLVKEEVERVAAEKAAIERRAAERFALERAESDQLQAESMSTQRADMKQRKAEQIEAGRAASERKEIERIAAEQAEVDRRAAERLGPERVDLEETNIELNGLEQAEFERNENERIWAEQVEAERRPSERLAAERAELARNDTERKALDPAELERKETERSQAEQVEAERTASERLAAERVELEKASIERNAAEQSELKRKDAERIRAEQIEVERTASERLAGERAELARNEVERKVTETVHLERTATEDITARKAKLNLTEHLRNSTHSSASAKLATVLEGRRLHPHGPRRYRAPSGHPEINCEPNGYSLRYSEVYENGNIQADATFGYHHEFDSSDPRYRFPPSFGERYYGHPPGFYATSVFTHSAGGSLYLASSQVALEDLAYQQCLGINAIVAFDEVTEWGPHLETRINHSSYGRVFPNVDQMRTESSEWHTALSKVKGYVDQRLAQGKNVMMYDVREGCWEAAATAIVYLMVTKTISWQDAYEELWPRRPCISDLNSTEEMEYTFQRIENWNVCTTQRYCQTVPDSIPKNWCGPPTDCQRGNQPF